MGIPQSDDKHIQSAIGRLASALRAIKIHDDPNGPLYMTGAWEKLGEPLFREGFKARQALEGLVGHEEFNRLLGEIIKEVEGKQPPRDKGFSIRR